MQSYTHDSDHDDDYDDDQGRIYMKGQPGRQAGRLEDFISDMIILVCEFFYGEVYILGCCCCRRETVVILITIIISLILRAVGKGFIMCRGQLASGFI